MRLAFDRGTLRFDAAAPAPLLEKLPGVLWDPRTAVYRAAPWHYPGIARALDDAGAEIDDAVREELAAAPFSRARAELC